MDFKKAFNEGKFLDIASEAQSAITPEEKLILGISLFKLGRDNDALGIFGAISSELEHMVKALFYMAKIYSQQGDMDSAKECLKKYTVFYPDDDEAHDILELPADKDALVSEPSVELAKIYAQQGHYEEALDIYSRLLKSSDQAPEVKKEAHNTQDKYILKTLETWLERIKR
jgi:tetratricopeptide (TPR) repeat protein